MDRLKAIKIIVVFLTFLLIFGMLSAVGIIFQKTNSSGTEVITQNLNQPKGSRIESFKLHNDNLYMLIKNGDTSDRIIIINTKNPKSTPSIININ